MSGPIASEDERITILDCIKVCILYAEPESNDPLREEVRKKHFLVESGQIILGFPGLFQYAHIRLEHYESSPDHPTPDWTVYGDVTIDVSASLEYWGCKQCGRLPDVGITPGRWRLRGLFQGGDAAVELAAEAETKPDYFEGDCVACQSDGTTVLPGGWDHLVV